MTILNKQSCNDELLGKITFTLYYKNEAKNPIFHISVKTKFEQADCAVFDDISLAKEIYISVTNNICYPCHLESVIEDYICNYELQKVIN